MLEFKMRQNIHAGKISKKSKPLSRDEKEYLRELLNQNARNELIEFDNIDIHDSIIDKLKLYPAKSIWACLACGKIIHVGFTRKSQYIYAEGKLFCDKACEKEYSEEKLLKNKIFKCYSPYNTRYND